MVKADPASKKRRTRRRKRREVSESSSSDDESGSEDGVQTPRQAAIPPAQPAPPAVESSDDTDSSESESSDEDMDATAQQKPDVATLPTQPAPEASRPRKRPASRSPSPPSPALPTFLPKDGGEEKEQQLKARFHKYWMASLADGFAEDLDEIRKEPSMTKSRLEMLIDSLGSGADVFSSPVDESSRRRTTEEMELVLGDR
ncbi:hypothetical protein CALVIDRAFT_600506 [Calocera viscosa TUFC12733]|uniref:Ribosome assembly protein 3 n=1 Tax=Calocera viscosa (strain TUFC12733) TaxID=1330018 RepID=A0A167JQ18_CALVF|nr:hypothetical protein CALVIDRAFT_600506 [Calocera viscosa TUFC12733]